MSVEEAVVTSEISPQQEIGSIRQPLVGLAENPGTTGDLLRLIGALSGETCQVADPGGLPAAVGLPQPVSNELANDPELLNDFILESRDYLASVETHLLAIEKNPADTESVHSVFRSFHTIKGLAGFLGLTPIQEVAHEVENVLDRTREGKLALSSTIIDAVLRAADYLNDCLGRLAQRESHGQSEFVLPANRDLLAAISRLASRRILADGPPEAAAEPLPRGDERSGACNSARTSTVKVDTAKLEYLVDMIGELLIAQSIVRNDRVLAAADNPMLSRNLAQLARVTETVQRTAMSMRMVPIGHLFGKMERLVRDLARKSGKQIELELSGEHAELDRNIVEELADPMVHMIRNAVDHGLESPEDRLACGKPPVGKIKLEAHHEAGCIVIRLTDDGRGMNRDRILAKARERGVVAPNARLSDDETLQLVFAPGFSTAEKVTDISGRGVGMDVVSEHIQNLRGRIEIKSVQGQGCTFTLRLPLTLAIIDGLVVGVAQERFIVPIFAMREMFCLREETRFTVEGRNEMVLFRGALLPVIRLREKFAIEGDAGSNLILIVIQGRDRDFCLAVDELIGKQEVVIKTLGSCFRDLPGIAGGAILGDGKVGLIIDVDSLSRSIHV